MGKFESATVMEMTIIHQKVEGMDRIITNEIKPGDRIVTAKSIMGIIMHHAVYLGTDHFGKHLIAENEFGKTCQGSDL